VIFLPIFQPYQSSISKLEQQNLKFLSLSSFIHEL
jgi:hypothetical protein